MKIPEKPQGYEDDLDDYDVIYKENSVPFAWGFEIKHHLGDERFNALRQHGKLVHLGDYFSGRWAVIVKELSNEECVAAAIKKHGEITKIHTGPKGGFQWVQYGDKKKKYGEVGTHFYSPEFCPDFDYKTDPRADVEPPSQAMLELAKRNKRKRAAKERAKAKKLALKEAKASTR